MVHSLLSSNQPETVRVHLLHAPELPAHVIDRLHCMVTRLGSSIKFHAVADSALGTLPAWGRVSQVMWYRLFLPDLLPATSRVLYLDCDTLVLDDVTPLWDLDMKACKIAAVSNVFMPEMVGWPRHLGIAEDGYFNSGALLIDLDAWRASGCGGHIAELAREHPERLQFPDQDALNLALASSRLALHPRWNCQNSIFYFSGANDVFGASAVAEARSHPAIVHFEGPELAKPWHYLSKHPYRSAYLSHRAHTPWPDVRVEGKTLGNRLLRPLPSAATARFLKRRAELAESFRQRVRLCSR